MKLLFQKCCLFFFMFIALTSCGLFDNGSSYVDPEFGEGILVDSQGRLTITQFGITWQFDRNIPYGQFANGDYWVVGPVNITAIYPKSRKVSGRTINGSMLNPSPSHDDRHGFDSSTPAMRYLPELNAALNISARNPLVLPNGTSLVSSISLSAEETEYNRINLGNISVLKTAAILTVLSEAPAPGSFRPPYSGTDKTIHHNTSELAPNLYRLKRLNPVDNTPSLSEAERLFERPWLDHVAGWNVRSIKPIENMPDYGREISRDSGIAALMLHLNFTDDEKRTLLIRFIQAGLDLYAVMKDGGTWPAAGGQNGGRKWPILFAGIMLSDTEMKNIGQRSGDYLYTYNYPTFGPGNEPPDYIHFQEDDQTFYVKTEDVARTSDAKKWNPDIRGGTPEPYSYNDAASNMAEWGIFHATNPYADNRAWSAEYRTCCTNISMTGNVLAARIMQSDSNAVTLWNHPALFDYQDRYMAVTAGEDINPSWRTLISGMDAIWASNTGWRSWDSFAKNMWDEYRDEY